MHVSAFLVAWGSAAACSAGNDAPPSYQAPRAAVQQAATAAAPRSLPRNDRRSVGFRSRTQLDEHFAKHGAEFGRVTRQEYLRAAQALRDAPVGGNIEELNRADGTIARYDRASGAFIAFDSDGIIRTFFKPNDGEAYFRRQARRGR
jgi:pyocin large subunit-like protein